LSGGGGLRLLILSGITAIKANKLIGKNGNRLFSRSSSGSKAVPSLNMALQSIVSSLEGVAQFIIPSLEGRLGWVLSRKGFKIGTHPNPVLNYSGSRRSNVRPAPYGLDFVIALPKIRSPQKGGAESSDRHLTGWVRSPYRAAHTAPFRKFGFTLAEVLITLGIIGVVAAMTLPSLIQNYQNKVLVNQTRKMYSVITNALVSYSSDMGTPNEFSGIFDSTNSINDIREGFSQYMQVLENCTTSQVRTSGGCGGIYTVGVQRATDETYAGQATTEVMNTSGRLVLKDGSFIVIYKDNTSSGTCFFEWTQTEDTDGNAITPTLQTSNRCGRIYFDVNGLKGPNIYGKDVFEIQVMAKKHQATDSLYRTLNGGASNVFISDDL